MHEKRAFEKFSDFEVSKLETGNGKLAPSHHRMRDLTCLDPSALPVSNNVEHRPSVCECGYARRPIYSLKAVMGLREQNPSIKHKRAIVPPP